MCQRSRRGMRNVMTHALVRKDACETADDLVTMALTFSGGGYRAQTSLASGEASRARNWPLRPADGDCAGLVQRPGPAPHGRADGGCLAAGQPGEPGWHPTS